MIVEATTAAWMGGLYPRGLRILYFVFEIFDEKFEIFDGRGDKSGLHGGSGPIDLRLVDRKPRQTFMSRSIPETLLPYSFFLLSPATYSRSAHRYPVA